MVRPVPAVLAGVFGVALLVVVAWPDAWAVNRAVVRWYVFWLQRGLPPSVTPEHWAAVLNVVLFVPAAACVSLALPRLRWWWVVLAAVLLSTAVEVVQATTGARQGDPLDVVTNALGALVGVGIAAVLERRWS